MGLTVGFSFWGVCERFGTDGLANTPDGHRYGRPLFVDALWKAGHEVIALQERREEIFFTSEEYTMQPVVEESNQAFWDVPDHQLGLSPDFPDIDVLFVEWRWPTYKNSGENPAEPDLIRQTELLKEYHDKRGIPVILWDTDLKMDAKDEMRWHNAIIADPSLDPREITRKRVSVPFWSDFKRLFEPVEYSYVYGYIGNNYERDASFKQYYQDPSRRLRDAGIQTSAYGNWLQRSPERKDPKTLIQDNPNIAFGRRHNFTESMKLASTFICTTHISKEEYYKFGFVPPRYLEMIACNLPALVPNEFRFNNILGNDCIVKSSADVEDKVLEISKFSIRERVEFVNSQQAALRGIGSFDVQHVVSLIESLVK